MANKMLIDAAHPEETRVVVVRGNRIEEFDFESANRKQLRGNIYLAKVTRVEPSLQAAFVEYGGNRHGFLAFSEIHPDYYQIPVADRQALLDEEARDRHDEHEEEEKPKEVRGRRRRGRAKSAASSDEAVSEDVPASETDGEIEGSEAGETERDALLAAAEEAATPEVSEPGVEGGNGELVEVRDDAKDEIESVGAAEDSLEEIPERRQRRGRQYKIQEVIKRRQVLLVQAVKEERGNKGAALTTYLSLAGRYSVLMPNTARGGGISRKVTNAADRKKMKEIATDLDVPEGMGVILRTAGANRTKAEIKRDFEYLLRLWETVRETTLSSTAPALVHEEGSLVKRAIRDLYNKDIDEVLVAGDGAFREAKDFMRMLMPSHAKNVKSYRDPLPIYTRFGVEAQLDAMFSSTVTLKSGGYIVINQTEALVAIDVNSGRATREHNIEDTALKTNLEAAEEVSRQLRLRDLAGLIVVDFIDMEENRNNRAVEKKLKDCLKNDRARIQVGRISHFGLLEMSRQRIRTGVLESSSEVCAICAGTGRVRSVPSVALHVLRMIEDSLLRNAGFDLLVRTPSSVALYILNQKRGHLREIESRFGIDVLFTADDTLSVGEHCVIQRGEPATGTPQLVAQLPPVVEEPEDEVFAEDEGEHEAPRQDNGREPRGERGPREAQQPREEGEAGRRRRRRRRRGRGRGGEDRAGVGFNGENQNDQAASDAEEIGSFEGDDEGLVVEAPAEESAAAAVMVDEATVPAATGEEVAVEDEPKPRRRGRRGGTRRGKGEAAEAGTDEAAAAVSAAPEIIATPVEEPIAEVVPEPEPEPVVEKAIPAPTPVQQAAEEIDRPRRTGWWSKVRGG
ncbi:Rne/Rng family ribonuclease [Flaviflagellibacter deserti]|uniref:Ribonuclease E n=1 Tax=Flaviflagellibacter deserti TaxID=2267266 RepID=A0ABV9Z4F4_9HYPH